VNEIELNVWQVNRGATAFYERLGYEIIRRTMKRAVSKDAI
jgi:ribosomal protein S18 acetylase RimI-like enzyme